MLSSSLLEILSCRFPRSRDSSLEARGQGAMGDEPWLVFNSVFCPEIFCMWMFVDMRL